VGAIPNRAGDRKRALSGHPREIIADARALLKMIRSRRTAIA